MIQITLAAFQIWKADTKITSEYPRSLYKAERDTDLRQNQFSILPCLALLPGSAHRPPTTGRRNSVVTMSSTIIIFIPIKSML